MSTAPISCKRPAAGLDPRIRRRNRRLGLLLSFLAIGFALSSLWFVRHHWIYPAPVKWWRPKW